MGYPLLDCRELANADSNPLNLVKMKYGIESVGKHTVVMLVLNESTIDLDYLLEKFSDDLVVNTYHWKGVDRVRIEGCVRNEDNFMVYYEYAKFLAKKHKLDEEADYLHDLLRDHEMHQQGMIKGTVDGIKSWLWLSK